MQFVHLTPLELSYTPELCNIFVKLRPVLHYTIVLQHNVHMYTLNTLMYLKNPSFLVFCCSFSDNFVVGIIFLCS
jgi:hypothetical protein